MDADLPQCMNRSRSDNELIHTVLLAEEYAVVREGVRALLERYADIAVVGEAASGWEAVREAERLCPDVVLMGIRLPELNGIEATRNIRARLPRTRVVILTMHCDGDHVQRAFCAGASGYLLKKATGAEVAEAIRASAEGRRFFDARIQDSVIDTIAGSTSVEKSGEVLADLSVREREVLQLVVEGVTSGEIAERLFLSVKTVETYRSRIMKKLRTPGIVPLVKFAIRHGITTAE